MPIQVASNIVPKNNAKWPVVDDTYVKGGLHVVADAAARDAIYLDATARLILKNGMLLVTASDARIWQYSGLGVWVELKKSSSFSHTQDTHAVEWVIQHNIHSKMFTYCVFDEDGFQILPNECQILDFDNLKVTFLQATAGTITLTFNV